MASGCDFQKGRFSVAMGGSEAFGSNYDRIFDKGKTIEVVEHAVCGSPHPDMPDILCQLPKGHESDHEHRFAQG